jgi:hypothetical protein
MRAVVARLGASADHPAIADRLPGRRSAQILAAMAQLMAAVRFATAKKGKASGGQV